MARTIWLILYGLTAASPSLAQSPLEHEDDPTAWDALRTNVDAVLAATRTPGAAVVVADAEGRVWMHVSGLADLATERAVDGNTRFRIGSISKLFVALAVMTLVEQGMVSLDDSVGNLVPEVYFHNPWEREHPVRLRHLLDHTTGWDMPHLAELAAGADRPWSILEGLAVHPHSRVSRWIPGSRSAYNNTGPTVAATVVEEIAGEPFEHYVRNAVLRPLGMNQTDWFYTDEYRRNGAVPYRNGEPMPYWELTNRAAGGMHSSIKDMAALLRMLLSRGEHGRVLSRRSLAVMEVPPGSPTARQDLQMGYGLGTVTLHHKGVLYHGHEGALPGVRALIAYSPRLGVGHAILSNAEGPAVGRIHRLLSDLETSDVPEPRLQAARTFNDAEQALSGFYRVISPSRELLTPLLNLMPWRLVVESDRASIRPLFGGQPRQLLPGGRSTFRHATTGLGVLVTGDDPLAGPVVHYGPQTLERIPALAALAPPVALGIWLLLGIPALLFAMIWIPRRLSNRLSGGPHIVVRLWPLLGVVSMLVATLTLVAVQSSVSPFSLLGQVTSASVLLFVCSVAFAIFSAGGLITWWRFRSAPMNTLVRWHSVALAVSNLMLAAYLLTHGWIGVQVWA